MSEGPAQAVTALLARWRGGDAAAYERLLPLLYGELRAVARRHMRREREDHTLESRALVHEAYLRIAGQGPFDLRDRTHFLATASHVMRQVLVDHARSRQAAKRDGGLRVGIEAALGIAAPEGLDVVVVDEALKALALLDARQAQIVELRFFAGLSIEEAAAALGLSAATVKREWATARAWLARELERHAGGDGPT